MALDLSYGTFQSQDQTSKAGLDLSYDSFQKGSTPQPSFLSKVGTSIKNYAEDSAQTVTGFGNAILHPLQSIQGTANNNFLQPFMQNIQSAGDSLYDLVHNNPSTQLLPSPSGSMPTNQTTDPQKVADAIDLIRYTSKGALSPITGLFKTASQIPGLKQVSDVLGIPFNGAGLAASYSSGKIIDWIPDSVMPQASKDILKAPIQDLASLAAQVALGGKIMDRIVGEVKSGNTVTPETAQKIVDDVKGPPPAPSGPDQSPSPGPSPQPTTAGTEPAPILTDGKVSKAATEINQHFAEQGLANIPKEELAQFTPTTKEFQLKAVADILSNPEIAKSMAMGDTPIPTEIKPTVLFNAVTEMARSTNDFETLKNLASSPVAAESSRLGQGLGATGFNKPEFSPVDAIKEVQDAKNAEVKPGAEEKVMSEAKTIKDTEVKKGVNPKTWSDFIDQIRCNY